MLSEKDLKRIRKLEKAGFNIIVAQKSGEVMYKTKEKDAGENQCEKCCNWCNNFILEPDPDPGDWARDGDMKAVCYAKSAVIAGGLENPSEWENVAVPIWCPEKAKTLSKKKKKKAAEELKFAKEQMKF